MKKLNTSLFIAAFGFMSLTQANAKVFELDKEHSSVGFKVRHLLANVSGSFKDFKGTFETDERGNLVKVTAIVKASSIDTNNKKRDEHLRSDDFFDIKKFAELTFVSDKFKIKPGATGKMPGQLTMHGVTKPVEFEVEFLGEAAGMGGSMTSGATGATKIDRKDFGLTWSKTLETGSVLVGDEVTISIEAEGYEKAPEKVAETTATKSKNNKAKK